MWPGRMARACGAIRLDAEAAFVAALPEAESDSGANPGQSPPTGGASAAPPAAATLAPHVGSTHRVSTSLRAALPQNPDVMNAPQGLLGTGNTAWEALMSPATTPSG